MDTINTGSLTEPTSFSILLNSMNRAIQLDMAIRDIEEYILTSRRTEVTEQQIDTLPIISSNGNECAVCLEPKDELCELQCHHFFCKTCITSWLVVRNACPMCRAAVFMEHSIVPTQSVQQGLRLLRQLVYAIMCEDARLAIWPSQTTQASNDNDEDENASNDNDENEEETIL